MLRIEHYPRRMFSEGRTPPNKELRERDADVGRKMNKMSPVTLRVDAAEHQIVRYELQNIDTDFLPAQRFPRLDGRRAAMEMGQPFAGVWLPRAIRIGFDLTRANGQVDARYASDSFPTVTRVRASRHPIRRRRSRRLGSRSSNEIEAIARTASASTTS